MFRPLKGLAHTAGQVADGLTDVLQNPFRDKNALVYTGKLSLRKSSVLGFTNLAGDMINNCLELLNQKVKIKLISSTTVEKSLGAGKVSKSGKITPWIFGISVFASDVVEYNIKFHVDPDFGVPGAFTVQNKHVTSFFLLQLTLQLAPGGKTVEFPCHSWVFPASSYKTDRVFFSNELYLTSDTPTGLVDARKSDLIALQGDGTGTRTASDRIYDYDVYNDLGSNRETLGGSQEFPYPRRCRTGRKVVNGAEVRTLLAVIKASFYVPADEDFPTSKNSDFLGSVVKGALQSVIPSITALIPFSETFQSFKEIDLLYDQGFDISKLATIPLQKFGLLGLKSPIQLVNQIIGTSDNSSLLKFPKPQVVQANKAAWMSDEEFARQTLSGANPVMIECLKVFPPVSKLPNATTAFQEYQFANHLNGFETVQQALEARKLFLLDYYDFYMPYVEKMNNLKDFQTFTYASRTIFFLKPDGTLKPVAIELSTTTSQRVFTPPDPGATDWIWELAKAHVAANDSGYHQVVSHWLKTHCCIEPFIIATHRQLSALHPLKPFLVPHFKHTLSINSHARETLINSGGIIESCFNFGMYGIEITSQAYRDWNLFEESLPADLIKRGMAVPDPTAKHGLRLTIQDYPYAADGLEIWSALENWTEEYVNTVYQNDQKVAGDAELQRWWHELIHVGHADLSKDTWWGSMGTKAKLVRTLTTIIWIASAQHAAVNFGQYAYLGYMPNHPTRTHKGIPELGDPEYEKLQRDGEKWYLSAVSRKSEAIKTMLVLEILSTHADDEEYLGQRSIANWTANELALNSFRRFSQQIKEVDAIIAARNNDPALKNRRGPVQVPYTLQAAESNNGLTGRGVPNSISI